MRQTTPSSRFRRWPRRSGGLPIPLIAASVLAAGCATLLPARLPSPEPGVRREHVRWAKSSCRLQTCREIFDIGERSYRVVTESRYVSPEEAAGRPRRSVLSRVGSSVLNSVLRSTGDSTVDYRVGIGTRRAYNSAGGPLRLLCDVVWIERIERFKRNDAEEGTSATVREGMTCRVQRLEDEDAPTSDSSVVLYRYQHGVPVTPIAIGASLDSLNEGWGPDFLPLLPMALSRHDGATYTITVRVGEVRFGILQHVWWDVRRDDGEVVAQIHRRFWPRELATLDVSLRATEEEAAVLRLIAAAFAHRPNVSASID